jgi:peptidoglycan/LPS O-acetylase OafA/YrhL
MTTVAAQTSSEAPITSILKASAPEKPFNTDRISALDFTRGFLVLLMVLYHWVNYFIGQQWGYYKYLRFLTPSFIFITGFVVSNVYLAKYDLRTLQIPKRLLKRGFKLLLVFFALNLARIVIVSYAGTAGPVNNLLSFDSLFAVFVSGNLPIVGGKLVSFSILVPISYLLMLSGALMVPYRIYWYTFHLTCVVLLVSIGILNSLRLGSYTLEFLTVGLLGVVAGFMPIKTINRLVRHPFRLAFVYLAYTIAITVWNVPFPLLVIGVLLSLMAIYLCGISISESSLVGREVVLLGKYSLFGYISQIVILQVLSLMLRKMDFGLAGLGLCFVAAFSLTIISVEIMNRVRLRSSLAEKLYKAVFA